MERMRCPRCGSLLYFGTTMQIPKPDGGYKTRVYHKCDSCHLTTDEIFDDGRLVFT